MRFVFDVVCFVSVVLKCELCSDSFVSRSSCALDTSLVNFNCQFDTTSHYLGRESQLRNCLDQIGL